ncbi:MAG: hypothetical protein ACUZ8H_02115 [Candidatus Anammoxibacter sp.]
MASRFLYFIPQLQGASKDDIKRAGILNNIKDLPEVEFCGVQNCHEGKPGVIIGFTHNHKPEEKNCPVGYFPDTQEWKKSVNGKFWVGVYKDQKPTPSDLIKKEAIRGHYVKLQDGNEWLIPLARVFPEGSPLPHALVLGENGEIIQEALPEYAKFSKIGERIYREFKIQCKLEEAAEGYTYLTQVEEWDAVTEALGINYYIDGEEISLLKLLTTANIAKIFQAIIDVPTMTAIAKAQVEAGKKKVDADTPDGQTLECGTKA